MDISNHWLSYRKLLRISSAVATALALCALMAWGLMPTPTEAQAPVCRDVSNITVCGDTLVAEVGTAFQLRGNIKMGPKGQPAVIHVTNMPNIFDGLDIVDTTYTSQFFHLTEVDVNSGCQTCLFGVVRFISDTPGSVLFGTDYAHHPTNPNSVIIGRLFVDPINGRVYFPPAGAVPVFVANGITRSVPYRFSFLSTAQVGNFFRDGGNSNELDQIEAAFDLQSKRFTSTVPVNLKINQDDENPNLQVTMRLVFGPLGVFTGTVDSFKMKLAGFVANVQNIVLQTGLFQAGLIQVLKLENPDMPAFDPNNSNLVLQFNNLRYEGATNRFTLGGVSIPIGDWSFGEAFKLTNQFLGIFHDDVNRTHTLQLTSTLKMGSVVTATKDLSVSVSIAGKFVTDTRLITAPRVLKPILVATVANLTTTLGPMNFQFTNLSMVGDPIQNFFGLQAGQAKIVWSGNFGAGVGGGMNNLKLGTDNTGKLIFSVQGGNLSAPPIKSGVLQGSSINGVFTVISRTIVFTFTGAMQVNLVGGGSISPTLVMNLRGGKNVQPQCGTGAPPGCLKRFEASLTAFAIKLAGFGIALASPRFRDDGGFEAQSANLTLPAGTGSLSTGISGLVITGNGDVQITGGQIEIPPLTIAGTSFAALRGGFSQVQIGTAKAYKFTGGATMSLPGLDPTSNTKISANVTVVSVPATGNLDELDVMVAFTAHPGIPIAGSGAELTGLSGAFSLKTGTATISVGIVVESQLKVPPPPSTIGTPVVTLNGTASLQVNPFKMTLGAQLKVLIFQVANATVEVGDGAGFNGGKGVHVNFNVDVLFVHGSADVHVGKVSNVTRFRGTATLTVGLQKNQFGNLPKQDRTFAGISFQAGQFDINNNGVADTTGLLGTFEILGFDITLFVDFNKTGSDRVKRVDADDYQLLRSSDINERIANQAPGYLRTFETVARGAEVEQVSTVIIPYVVTKTTTVMFGITYPPTVTTPPTVTLGVPGRGILTPASANNVDVFYGTDFTTTITGTNDIWYTIKNAPTGTYTLRLANEPPTGTYTTYMIVANGKPTVTITSAYCAGSIASGITMDCAPGADGNKMYVNFAANDVDDPDAKITVMYGETPTNTFVVTSGLPLTTTAAQWVWSETPSGKYNIYVEVDDGKHAPVMAVATTTVTITDARPPGVPTGLTATAQAGQLNVTWNPNTEDDLAGYVIGFGTTPITTSFAYTRDMGNKEIIFTGTNQIDAKLWGLKDDQIIYYSIRAYDIDGNYSAWATPVSGKPWALSPRAWTPEPNGTGTGSSVSAAFDTIMLTSTMPLNTTTFNVKDSNGNVVAGTLSYLYDLDGLNVMGIQFKPSALLTNGAIYTATLKGGVSGVKAQDNRTMNADYKWVFTVQLAKVYLPLLVR